MSKLGAWAATSSSGTWDEDKHPRDDIGRFALSRWARAKGSSTEGVKSAAGGGEGATNVGARRKAARAVMKRLGIRKASPAEFKGAFDAAFPKGSRFEHHVTHYSEEELSKMGLFLSSDGKAGVLVKDHGDGRIEASALFSTSETKGAGIAMLMHAVDNLGANYVECYGGTLNKMYAGLGFSTSDKFPFDPSQAAQGWDYERNDHPPYHLMPLTRHGD